MEQYDSLAVAIEIQSKRERLQNALAEIKKRAEDHRKSLDQIQNYTDTDYLEGLADAYEICYNLFEEIITGGENNA